MNFYQIYLITNLKNNKKYVGQVIQHKNRDYLVRFHEHLDGIAYENTRRLNSAIKHYGRDAFKTELIEENIPEDQIDEKEIYYIAFFDTYYLNKKGYNMTLGGQGIHGYKFTYRDRQKISEAGKKHWIELRQNPERLQLRNQKISNKLKGQLKSIEAKKHLSQAAKKRFENAPGTFTGRKHSEESKRIVAEKNGYPIGMYDKNSGELLHTFISCGDATKYLLENHMTENKSAFTRILTVCKGIKGQGKTAYGYVWKFLTDKQRSSKIDTY